MSTTHPKIKKGGNMSKKLRASKRHKTNSYLKGAGSLLGIFGGYYHKEIMSLIKSDKESLNGDWQNIADDFKKSKNNFSF
ncbi:MULTISPECIES: hypothetical protein [Olivibacter]|uniref:YtxH-like protein n=1 Tax=Olivibacter jilunii TaxID=985016 RepID=A0ABW6AXE4_9SPHI